MDLSLYRIQILSRKLLRFDANCLRFQTYDAFIFMPVKMQNRSSVVSALLTCKTQMMSCGPEQLGLLIKQGKS